MGYMASKVTLYIACYIGVVIWRVWYLFKVMLFYHSTVDDTGGVHILNPMGSVFLETNTSVSCLNCICEPLSYHMVRLSSWMHMCM